MAILKECTHRLGAGGKCSYRNPLSAEACRKCLKSLRRGGLDYWIEYTVSGKRKREKIGPSKAAAETREAEIRKAKVEGRIIRRDHSGNITLAQAAEWYLGLNSVQAKKSFKRDSQQLKALCRILDNRAIRDIHVGLMEDFRTMRLKEESKFNRTGLIRPSTVNKEVAQLVTLMHKLVDHEKIETTPLRRKIPRLEEDNIRNKTLSLEEFNSIRSHLKSPLFEWATIAYYTAMRQGEIMKLCWDEVDLDEGLIYVHGENTKNSLSKTIPIHPELRQLFMEMQKLHRTGRLIRNNGRPVNTYSGNLKLEWNKAIQSAGIKDFHFHDLRHIATNNLRIAGNDLLRIKAITGHKSDSAFRRYNNVTIKELQGVVWHNQ